VQPRGSEVDHALIAGAAGAPRACLRAVGVLSKGPATTPRAQGTANRRFSISRTSCWNALGADPSEVHNENNDAPHSTLGSIQGDSEVSPSCFRHHFSIGGQAALISAPGYLVLHCRRLLRRALRKSQSRGTVLTNRSFLFAFRATGPMSTEPVEQRAADSPRRALSSGEIGRTCRAGFTLRGKARSVS